MGDRCYVQYRVHPEDIAKLLELEPRLTYIEPSCDYGDAENRYGVYDAMGFDPDGAPDDGMRQLEEVNYGGAGDWEIMAEAGIRFYGWSGAGGDYGEIDFHCDGKELRTADAGFDGGYVIHMLDGDFLPQTLDRLREYEASRLKVFAEIDEAWSLLPCNMREAKQC